MKADKLDGKAREERRRRVIMAELRDLGADPSSLVKKSLYELMDLRSTYVQRELMGPPGP